MVYTLATGNYIYFMWKNRYNSFVTRDEIWKFHLRLDFFLIYIILLIILTYILKQLCLFPLLGYHLEESI